MAGETGKLVWDKDGQRYYETGTKNVALFVAKNDGTGGYNYGVAWNGVTGITESPSGAEATDLWADDRKYATLRSAEQLGGTITAYTYPTEWEVCDGSATPSGATGLHFGQQARRKFSLAYITTEGNDVALNDYGEKLHILYGATASPSERAYATINDSPEAIEFSWEFETTPIDVSISVTSSGTTTTTDYKPMSLITIDSALKMLPNETPEAYATRQEAHFNKYKALKAFIYGEDADAANNTPATNATLPTPQQVYNLITTGSASGG